MRYTLRAPIDGNIVLQYPDRRISANRDGVELSLDVGEKGNVSHAVASVQVSSEKAAAFRSSTGPGVRGSAFTLSIGGDRELYELLLAALQDFELELAFALPGNALRRLRWRDVEHRFVPETPGEESLLSVTSYSTSNNYPDSVAKITSEGFGQLLEYTAHTKALLAVKGFWLQGRNDFEEFRYVQAFYNFYFVLEWLYANGKFKKAGVLYEFEKSSLLNSAFDAAIQSLRRDQRHWARMLKDMPWLQGEAVDVPAIRRYVVEVRGRAHHVSAKGSARSPSRDGGQHFETAAVITMYVARKVIESEERAIKARTYSLAPLV